ncbi:hypothetical protein [Hyphococcus luteus]|uniref:Sel1 repeat family protein n=1 Tax=Hyphococcus luteus TaxID=2058213 RepID=A0A2S7K7G9_9PROT|nr:hypothetical protein [Marinicaulis flavus]PQA88432.1 hypothetical protein CW354_09070 [Marinicaulis flavus]
MKMLSSSRLLVLVCAASLAACAGGGPRGGPQGGLAAGPVGVNQPTALLAKARDFQAREGCARAAPVYRIVASHGAGHDVAQYELGACLLEMQGESDAETGLFRQEALFWLSRAAWAGNPRAQGKLAEILSGAPAYAASHVAPDPEKAMMWAIVYGDNGVRNVYGLADTPQLVSSHLDAVLSPEARAQAKREAASFRKITMAEFEPMAREDEDGAERRTGDFGASPDGRRKPPRR